MIACDKAVNNLQNGYVLSRNGAWITIDQALTEEEAYCRRVYEGAIVIDKRWVQLETITFPEERPEPKIAKPKARAEGDYLSDRETKILSASELENKMRDTQENAALDTQSMGISEEDAVALDDIAGESDGNELVPDTVRLEIKPGEETEIRTGKTDSIPVAGNDEDGWARARARRLYIITSSLAAAALLAAAVIAVLRIFV